MIAHAPFGPNSNNTGVEFSTVRAKGNFEIKNVVWTSEQFAQEISVIDGYTKFIDDLQKQFKEKPLNSKILYNGSTSIHSNAVARTHSAHNDAS